jgi:broad specificity phosphatase PhoE
VFEAKRTLFLVRHGQTDWNVQERFQGQLDVPLNALGRRQAAATKSYLAGTPFDRVYSSPLRRAFDTARVVVGDVPIVTDSRLSEIHHGSWQGRTKREIARRWPGQWDKWQEQPQFTPPGGEPPALVRLRVEDFLCSMRGTNILCVSHGVIIQTFLSILSGDKLDHLAVPANGSIQVFRFRNKNVL